MGSESITINDFLNFLNTDFKIFNFRKRTFQNVTQVATEIFSKSNDEIALIYTVDDDVLKTTLVEDIRKYFLENVPKKYSSFLINFNIQSDKDFVKSKVEDIAKEFDFNIVCSHFKYFLEKL